MIHLQLFTETQAPLCSAKTSKAMRVFLALGSLFFFSSLLKTVSEGLFQKPGRASFPPRGWNSYDSFSWIITEEEFLENAEIVSKKLLDHGYEYVVVDYLWYRRKGKGAYTNSLGFDVIDEWGRVIPDPERWPSSRGGKGFKEVAQKVHNMGLKFGIHVMRGISTQAVNANTPILDTLKGDYYEDSERQWRARDIGLKERTCAWMSSGFMSVDTELGAGRAFLRSLYQQYAEWGVDFVKHDCIFGDDLDVNEISLVSETLKELNRPILYSISPGTRVTPAMAADVSNMVNMYRITGDDWDLWEDVEAHFSVSRGFAASGLIGAEGLLGKSWPDLDMLPLGWLSDPGSNEGPHRKCNLTFDEQKTQMTLWSMAKSPLIFGGDLRSIDQRTLSLITNPIPLEINSFSTNNMEFPYINARKGLISRSYVPVSNKYDLSSLTLASCEDHNARSWVAQDKEKICSKGSLEKNAKTPFCLYRSQPFLTSDEEIVYKQHYQGKFQLLSSKKEELCLSTSTGKKLASQKMKSSSLSPCKWAANQMWELHQNGTLVNSYSGLCAKMGPTEGNSNAGGIRSWIATGRRGEIYVSFFNLNSEKMVISAQIEDLARVLFKNNLRKSCNCSEVWSAKYMGVVKQSLSMEVEGHGCSLFVLNCN